MPGAVAEALPQIAMAVDLAVEALRGGGRVHYFGAGTSGRLAVLDAAELPPTFGVDPGLVVAHHAGGIGADLAARSRTSRTTPRSAPARPGDAAPAATWPSASPRAAAPRTSSARCAAAAEAGAHTVLISSNPAAAAGAEVDVHIAVDTGPEAVTGSTRMKAGTAAKLVLNAMSTAAMVRLGRTYSNLMVSMNARNSKLRGRVVKILVEATGMDAETCAAALADSGGDTRAALVSLLCDVSPGPRRRGPQGLRAVRYARRCARSTEITSPGVRERVHLPMRKFCTLVAALSVALAVPACAPSTKSSSGGKVHLTVLSWRPEDTAGYKKIFAPYEKSHPKVKIDFKPIKNTEYLTVLPTELKKSQGGPDVVQLKPYGPIQSLITAGNLAPLDGQVDASKWDPTDPAGGQGQAGRQAVRRPVRACRPSRCSTTRRSSRTRGSSRRRRGPSSSPACDKLKKAGITPLATSGLQPWVLAIDHQIFGATRYGGDDFEKAALAGQKNFTDPDYTASLDDDGQAQAVLPGQGRRGRLPGRADAVHQRQGRDVPGRVV